MLNSGKATICLVIPGAVFLGDPKRNCPLGILYVASALEDAGYAPKVIDLRGTKKDAWKRLLPEAEIYAFTATSPEYESVAQMAEWVQRKNGAATILGGVHGTILKEQIDNRFNIIIIGEGETAIVEAVKDCERGPTKRIYQHPRIQDLDDLAFPARHLLPNSSVVSSSLVDDGDPGTPISGSRGCPYECAFCASPVIWNGTVTFRSPENIVDEIKFLIKQYGIREIRFQDDTFALKKKRVLELCEQLKPLKIKWRGSSRVDVGQSPEVLKAMKDSGCAEIGYGVESISPAARKLCNKGITNEQIESAIERTKAAGIRVRLYMIVGLPGEEKGLADRSIAFWKKTQPDLVMLSSLVPYLGTALAMQPEKYNMTIKSKDYTQYPSMIGMYGNELKTPFIVGYDNWTDDELREERRRMFEFIENSGMGGGK